MTITPLKTPEEAKDTLDQTIEELKKIDYMEYYTKNKYHIRHQTHISLEMIDAWQKGNVQEMEFKFSIMPSSEKKFYDDRTQLWLLNPSIDQLTTTVTSKGLAVGAWHFFGPNGLISGLSQKGLKIKQMEPDDFGILFKDLVVASILNPLEGC